MRVLGETLALRPGLLSAASLRLKTLARMLSHADTTQQQNFHLRRLGFSLHHPVRLPRFSLSEFAMWRKQPRWLHFACLSWPPKRHTATGYNPDREVGICQKRILSPIGRHIKPSNYGPRSLPVLARTDPTGAHL